MAPKEINTHGIRIVLEDGVEVVLDGNHRREPVMPQGVMTIGQAVEASRRSASLDAMREKVRAFYEERNLEDRVQILPGGDTVHVIAAPKG